MRVVNQTGLPQSVQVSRKYDRAKQKVLLQPGIQEVDDAYGFEEADLVSYTWLKGIDAEGATVPIVALEYIPEPEPEQPAPMPEQNEAITLDHSLVGEGVVVHGGPKPSETEDDNRENAQDSETAAEDSPKVDKPESQGSHKQSKKTR